MSLPRLASATVIAFTLLSLSTLMQAAQTASCNFTTFNAPSGYSLSQVNGISDDGTVVGQLSNNKTFEIVGFSYTAGSGFTEYEVPKSLNTWTYGLNASGANAGSYQDKNYPENIHGFVLQSGKMTEVNYPKATNTWLFNVNQVGNSVGSFSAGSVTKGFMLVNGDYTAITYPSSQTTFPMAINNNGVVVGYGTSGLVSTGFVWQDGKFTSVQYPGAKYGTGLSGINDSGIIVGNHFSADRIFGFIYENSEFENIDYPDATFAVTGGINNGGVISGQAYFKGGNSVGFTAVCK
jgi:uncharacterized membrane protein